MLDFSRAEDKRYFGITAAQYVCIGMTFAGLWMYNYRRKAGEMLTPDLTRLPPKPGPAGAKKAKR